MNDIYVYVCMYIFIQIEREREVDRKLCGLSNYVN